MNYPEALLAYNPRVIDASVSAVGGWDPLASTGMSAAPLHLTVYLEQLSADQAALLLRQVDSIGGSADSVTASAAILADLSAAEDSATTETAAASSVVMVSASEKQFDRLLAVLRRLDPSLGQAISRTIESYLRRRWLLNCGTSQLELGPRPVIMGVLNVTPDSFSDGGRFSSAEAAVEHGLALLSEGATVLDVGGESTRPGAAEVDVEEELARVLPVVAGLAGKHGAMVSIDTRKPAVARAALDAGAAIVNDISGLTDPEMAELVAGHGCGVVLMHMQGEPRTMQLDPHYDEVVGEVARWLRQALLAAERAGVDPERMIIDPGIGFGKTMVHNLSLLRRLRELRSLGRPILVGTSRKRFIGTLTGEESAELRLSGTIATCVWARQCGASMFRVHDVTEVAKALTVTAAMEATIE